MKEHEREREREGEGESKFLKQETEYPQNSCDYFQQMSNYF